MIGFQRPSGRTGLRTGLQPASNGFSACWVRIYFSNGPQPLITSFGLPLSRRISRIAPNPSFLLRRGILLLLLPFHAKSELIWFGCKRCHSDETNSYFTSSQVRERKISIRIRSIHTEWTLQEENPSFHFQGGDLRLSNSPIQPKGGGKPRT